MAVKQNKKTYEETVLEKSERIMNGVAYWGAFYRKNPQRFVKDYLNINLKLFQKILIYCFATNYYSTYIASRGSGKTWLTSLYCVVRCILYPGSKIVVASGVKSQAIEVIQKIEMDFLKNYSWGSENLRKEISFISSGINNARVDFRNGSFISVVTANDNARHNRANVIVVDEFRVVDLSVINTVLRKFLTAPRSPGYLSKPEYAHLSERNCEMYMSSAWYKSHWSFEKVKSYFANMLDSDKKYFCCSLPYQLAIKENLLSREQVEDEMSEADFDPMSFSIEMQSLFWGSSDSAFFKYDDINARRRIKRGFYPLDIYKSKQMKLPELAPNERRILSVDIALMASKKHNNDASCLIINSCILNENQTYTNNIVYIETHEGLNTDELGIIVMRTFYQYNCTDLVIDAGGVGLGVADYIFKNQYDPEYGESYDALCCCNDDAMAERCHVRTAKKVVWSIKASASFNTNAATGLRSAFLNGTVNLLISEFDSDEELKKIRGYGSMTDIERAKMKVPYIQTSLLVNELINLEHEVNGTNIKIHERSGMRKDRFSSLEYNVAIAREIYANKKQRQQESIMDYLIPARAPKSSRIYK